MSNANFFRMEQNRQEESSSLTSKIEVDNSISKKGCTETLEVRKLKAFCIQLIPLVIRSTVHLCELGARLQHKWAHLVKTLVRWWVLHREDMKWRETRFTKVVILVRQVFSKTLRLTYDAFSVWSSLFGWGTDDEWWRWLHVDGCGSA